MASVVCAILFTPLSATNISVEELKLQKANVVRISKRRITTRATGLLAFCSLSKDVYRRSCGRSTTPFGHLSELAPCCRNIGSSSHERITGFWVGPDIDDGWGFVEASVNQVTSL